ncbi:hypothetical protein INT44_005472 [Umbelopsis vinacea]|uniref:Ricin B lectin domain-containing protein n=1 Tax=Umbelopsis vinacea TaxID=44442 RepID=A0A8H7Q851_9FUNG|nr:hypothetical protein INT44_005472 [Umbelopsis vinacea]
MSSIPQGNFWIISRKNGTALDVFDGQTKDGANVIIWPQKFNDSDNQLWAYDNGCFVNKKSGLGNTKRLLQKLPFCNTSYANRNENFIGHHKTSTAKPDHVFSQVPLRKRRMLCKTPANRASRNNRLVFFGFDNGFIYSAAYPNLVLDIKGEGAKDGASVILYNRKENDNLNQLWDMEPHAQFEGSLNLAATDSMTHKKETFGLPTPGYGAQINVPPGLTSVPDRPQLQYSGTANSTVSQEDWSAQVQSLHPAHAQGVNRPVPPPPQSQGPQSSQGNYPPPPQSQGPQSSQGNYPPPPQSQGSQSSHGNYPPPQGYNSPPAPGYGTSPTQSYGGPPPQQYGEGSYQQSNYPPPPPPDKYNYAPPSAGGYSNYPPPPVQQGSYGAYPPPPPGHGGYSSPPIQQGGYSSPLPPNQQGGYGQQQQYFSQNSYNQQQGSYPPPPPGY